MALIVGLIVAFGFICLGIGLKRAPDEEQLYVKKRSTVVLYGNND